MAVILWISTGLAFHAMKAYLTFFPKIYPKKPLKCIKQSYVVKGRHTLTYYWLNLKKGKLISVH